MHSRRILVGLAGLAAVPGALAHPHEAHGAEQHGHAEEQVMAFRQLLREAITAKDVGKLRVLYADGFTHIHGSGKVEGKDSRIVSLLAGEPVIETAPAEELTLRVFGPDTVVITGRSPILNRTENRAYDFRWMAVHVRTAGDWRLAASQATRLPVSA
ncbi:MAG: hypothetical protein AVDCRST_MAG90-557 [uncultured Microvirga sp.]|uniref:DUF4440 domain-containing protein n=1 Tax=uncultured Microvirga sp. TaxID=412392 RepID=A0A6J4KS48_9HYPH|nr:MAG: hypothetical protein AVDCRST_MAG90-557 [uncultured Microvirga sp.]